MIRAGQLIISGISGTVLTDDEKSFIEKEDIGGVILFSQNYDSPAQLAELVNSIQMLRSDYPLFISVDHEGGRVIRFKKNFTQFPSMNLISQLDSPKICYNVHKIMAEELHACGINVNFSPVCDVLTNPSNKVIGDRAYGSDGEVVAKFISSAIRGLQTSGVLACAKHFPGHGSTTKDSHFDLPIVKTSMEDLQNIELVPFIKAIKSRVEMMMMGHLVVDALDDKLPCSLSKKVHDYLRNELKYSKIIVSDDMQMKAIADNYSTEEAAILALQAGTDMLVYRDMSEAQKALQGIKDSMKTMDLKNEDLNAKVKRVIACKKQNFADYKPVYIPSLTNKINSKATQIFVEDLQGMLSDLNDQV